ncbi:PilZ domain-containing protein [Fontivita pretiosa]|uniref:PilZ domain-containing protein n=1 Tax=Fontivita pretiosa TaxID=2989684 RepID=UPI003D16ED41
MTTLHERAAQIVSDHNEPQVEIKIRAERRAHRRADLEQQGLTVERWDGARRVGKPFGQIIDLSAGGVRIRTDQQNIRPENQIRLRLELPEYAGICPFVDASGPSLQPKREWVGWLAVSRVQKVDEKRVDVAGRLVDMEDLDRGMLSLYLSAQPLAA